MFPLFSVYLILVILGFNPLKYKSLNAKQKHVRILSLNSSGLSLYDSDFTTDSGRYFARYRIDSDWCFFGAREYSRPFNVLS